MNVHGLPDRSEVRHWMVCLGPTPPSRASCMVLAWRVDDQRSVAAIVEGIPVEARDPESETCRGARRANREGRWDSRRLCLDLQVHRH